MLFYSKLNGVSSAPMQQGWPTTSRAVPAWVQPAGPGKGVPPLHLAFEGLSEGAVSSPRAVGPWTRERLTHGRKPRKGHQGGRGTGGEAEELGLFVLEKRWLRGPQ